MPYQTIRVRPGRYYRLDYYGRSHAPFITTAVITCILLICAATYAVRYQEQVCPPGRTEYHGPAC